MYSHFSLLDNQDTVLLCYHLSLFFPLFFPLAQQNSPKIHEGWWAYKEVVQGSFVPGKCTFILLTLFLGR